MKDMNKRLFLTIAMCLAVSWLWYTLVPHPPPAKSGSTAPAAGSPSPAPAAPIAPQAGGTAKGPDVPRGTAATPRKPAEKVVLETDLLRLRVTTDGAALESAVLKGPKFKRHKEGSKEESQVDLAESRAGEPAPMSTVLKSADGAVLIPADAPYELLRHDQRSASFRTEAGGVSMVKTFTADPTTYKVDLNVEVRSTSGVNGQLAVLYGSHAEAPSGGFLGSRSNLPARAICMAGSKIERVAVGAKTPAWDGPGPAAFAGVDEQYFLSAIVPPPQPPATCHLEASPQGSLVATLALPVTVPPGGSSSLSFIGFEGPKDTDALAAVARPLKDSVDLGFWSIIANVLLGILRFFHKVVPPHNWGVAIILLTLTMKALTFPLQHKSMKSMQEMQRIQPQLEELKKKYAGDTQRQNLEQMKLFKEHGVNPMGSCLPMLIQMPIWFALYTTLQVSVELYNAVFIPGWIDDLTAKDPHYILPVAMGITMILTQVLTPAPMSNPSQKTMGYVMSGVFSLFMLSLPAGLTLYIFVNNVLSIAQQMYLRRAMKLPVPPASGQTVAVSAKRV
jgi:YidC/Oxa1 family membrane protein insertase